MNDYSFSPASAACQGAFRPPVARAIRTVSLCDHRPPTVPLARRPGWRRVHKLPGLRFIQGDAEALPVFDRSCDVVVNVEAASLYEDPARFFAEVERVLRPGGMFLFADLCFPHEVAGLR